MKILKSLFFLLLIVYFSTIAVCTTVETDENSGVELEKVTGIDKVVLLHKLYNDNRYSNLTQANNYALEALDIAQNIENDSLIAESYYRIGLSYYYMDYWSLAIDNFLLAIESDYGKSSPLFTSRCSNNIGICYEYLGKYPKAAAYYFKSVDASEKNGDSLLVAKTQLNIGMLYIRMWEYNKSIKILKTSIVGLKKFNDTLDIISAYHNLFIAEGRLKNVNITKTYFEKALSMALSRNDSLKISDIQVDYGNLLYSWGRYSEAGKHLKRGLNYTDSTNVATYYYIRFSIGKNEMDIGNLDKAGLLMTEAYEKLKEYDTKTWLTGILLNLSRLYAKQNKIELSYKYMEKAMDHERMLFDKEKLKSISEIEIKYETEKKEQILAIQKLQIKSQKRTIYFVVIIAIVFAVALGFVLLLIKKIKLTNKNLFERNKELTNRWEKLKVCDIPEKGDKKSNIIYKSISEIMNNEQLFTNPELSVDMVSKIISSNSKYVSRAIKEKTGMNFNSYINTHRIEEAKKILLNPVQKSWSLDAVAEKCGFNNPTTFYISFKKYTGLTPATYRNIN